jgi:hypothetical protein
VSSPGGPIDADAVLLGLTEPPAHGAVKSDDRHVFESVQFPNKLLKAGRVGMTIASATDPQKFSASFLEIRVEIEKGLRDRDVLRKAKQTILAPTLRKEEKIAIRRMMSSYWDNSSIFCMDLVGAVVRQGTFVEKMHGFGWLFSPTARSTMSRSIVKYERFFEIMAAYPGRVAVPTLDVDLVWFAPSARLSSVYIGG